MSSIDPLAVKDLMSFMSLYPIDKILFEQTETPIEHTVAASYDNGGFVMPKTDILTIPNPIGKKAFINMKWSIDGVNYYPQKATLYNPGNPVPEGRTGATVGCCIDEDEIQFFFTHYYLVAVNFRIKYVLDNIL